jgi:hypothetical protein
MKEGENHIDPAGFEGVDLRTLTDEQVQSILDQYPILRDTLAGYQLGQQIISLIGVRQAATEMPDIKQILDDENRWVFHIDLTKKTHVQGKNNI